MHPRNPSKRKRSQPTGLSSSQEEHGPIAPQASPPSQRPLAHAWITPELIAENQRVWSGAYGRNIGEDETVEIITNIRRFAETLLRARKERTGET